MSMRKITLPCGQEAVVGVKHQEAVLCAAGEKEPSRGTMATASFPGLGNPDRWHSAIIGFPFPWDPFCRRRGRVLAMTALLAVLRRKAPWLTKADRAAIFFAACPEFSARKVSERQQRKRLAEVLIKGGLGALISHVGQKALTEVGKVIAEWDAGIRQPIQAALLEHAEAAP